MQNVTKHKRQYRLYLLVLHFRLTLFILRFGNTIFKRNVGMYVTCNVHSL